MIKAKEKPVADSKALTFVADDCDSDELVIAKAALSPSVSGAIVSDAFLGNTMGDDVSLMEMANVLTENARQAQRGDLSHLESMLIAQATGLQTIFTSLAKRAQAQQSQRNFESFLSLAMKAQAQSRATIQAVVELKYPRQVAFVKQTNVSHGPQQINNQIDADADFRTEEIQSQRSKLLVG